LAGAVSDFKLLSLISALESKRGTKDWKDSLPTNHPIH
jgi:hypothetical protein